MADCEYYSRGKCKLDGCFCFLLNEEQYRCDDYVSAEEVDNNG